MQTILIISDDRSTGFALRGTLEQANYRVTLAYDGQSGLHRLTQVRPSLVILGSALRDRNALDLLRTIRQDRRTENSYVLMISPRKDDTERIIAFELGADDYLSYPLSLREVVARVRSGFRRVRADLPTRTEQPVLSYEGLQLDSTRRRVTLNGRLVDLTPTEFNLLVMLMQQPGIVFSRTELIHKRHNTDYESLERTLDSHIRNLRRKIEPDPTRPFYVQTVYGIGYRFGEP